MHRIDHTHYHYDDHEPLECADLTLNHEKLAEKYGETVQHLVHVLRRYFGQVQVSSAFAQGLELEIGSALHDFARDVSHEIAGAYTTVALTNARRSTETMFAALAGGALVAHRANMKGEGSHGVARAFAEIAACEGRPEILREHFPDDASDAPAKEA